MKWLWKLLGCWCSKHNCSTGDAGCHECWEEFMREW